MLEVAGDKASKDKRGNVRVTPRIDENQTTMEMEPMSTSSKHSTGHASTVQTNQNENYLTNPNERHLKKDKGSSKIISVNQTSIKKKQEKPRKRVRWETAPTESQECEDVTPSKMPKRLTEEIKHIKKPMIKKDPNESQSESDTENVPNQHFSCNECEKIFSDRKLFQKHQNDHRQFTFYKCHQCPKSCSNGAALSTHMEIHAQAKSSKYPCPFEGCFH